MQEGANSSTSQERTGDAVAETWEIMPGECQEEGGISEKENGAGRTENISTERTAKGSPERRKGSLKPHVTEEGQSHPRASPWVPQRHNRLENENPTQFHLKLEDTNPRVTCPSTQSFSQAEDGEILLQSVYLAASCAREARLLVLVTCPKTLHQMPLLQGPPGFIYRLEL